MDIDHFLLGLKRDRRYAGQIAHEERIPARDASYRELDAPLDDRLREALRREGIHRFYSHQARAINAARRGEHVVVVTSTASGKTWCYNAPVLDRVLREPSARALYLFPTKALAQDQLGKLAALDLGPQLAATFDGDTPREHRRAVKAGAGIVLTNPDMLSVGILPHHATWRTFFRHLRFVVVDEVHAYRGVFGSHVANVLRRLRRVCRFHGSDPLFLCSSATIANPEELVARLTGANPTLVDEDGSPSGGRRFVFWNPPTLAENDAMRRSTNYETTSLFTRLVSTGSRTIAFARARQTAELILRYSRDSLTAAGEASADKISSYRAGYLPEDRRAIERALFTGDLLGVVSTNALELGVDIGGLDACVLNGFPGTIASAWQQAGRAGRGKDEGLAILVARDNPLDQFLIRRPDYFFGRPHEHALVDPDNPHVLRAHLRAAALELPITEDDTAIYGPAVYLPLKELAGEGELREVAGRWLYAGRDEYPAAAINLRSATNDAFAIREEGSGRLVGSEERDHVHHTLHEGAVYLHLGDSFLVTLLVEAERVAWVRRTDVDYYTQPIDTTHIAPDEPEDRKPLGRANAFFGLARVTNQVLGFRRKQHFSDNVLGVEELDLAPRHMRTEAVWFTLPLELAGALRERGVDLAGGLHAVEHALIGLTPLRAMCDRNDVGGVSMEHDARHGAPTVYVYDAHQGGVGIAERCYDLLEDLLRDTRAHIAGCSCADGCPSCIQSPKCGNNNEPLDKAAALEILDAALG